MAGCEPGYWVRQAREPVRFAAAVAALAAQDVSVFVEIGPDGTLSALGPAALPGAGDQEAVFIPVLRPGQPAPAAVTAALARAHVHGVAVDWAAVLPAGQRTDLPTYAFRHQRYWPQPGPAPAGDDAAGGSREALFTVEWVPLPAQATAVGGRWAVLGADRPGLARGLAEVGVPVRTYADLAALTEAVDAGEPVPDGVLAWAGAAAGGAGADDAPSAARLATARALGLVQQWLAEESLSSSRLVVVTRGAVAAVLVEGVPDLAGASVWGLVRSAQSENPDRLVMIDLPADGAVGETGELGVLVAAGGSGEPELAIRAQAVYGRRLTRRDSRPAPTDPAAPRRGGTVLVTGGTGMLGGLLARHLAGTGRASEVVLASRSGPAAAGAAALAASVAGRGAGVQVTACDAADRAALAGLLAGTRDKGPLTMVVHMAGVVDDGIIGSLTPERVQAVMRPKADAAWHLHELTRDAGPGRVRAVLLGRGHLRRRRAGQLRGGQRVLGRAGRCPPGRGPARDLAGLGAVGRRQRHLGSSRPGRPGPDGPQRDGLR